MTQTALKVLICEDDRIHAEQFENEIGDFVEGSVEFIFAQNVPEGRARYAEHNGAFDLIIMDGCLNSDGNPDGCDLTREFRQQGFRGSMLTASNNSDMNNFLMQSGCSHKAKNKHQVAVIAIDLLNALASKPKPPGGTLAGPRPPSTARL